MRTAHAIFRTVLWRASISAVFSAVSRVEENRKACIATKSPKKRSFMKLYVQKCIKCFRNEKNNYKYRRAEDKRLVLWLIMYRVVIVQIVRVQRTINALRKILFQIKR